MLPIPPWARRNRRRRAPIQTDPPFRGGTGHDQPGQSWGGPNAPWFRNPNTGRGRYSGGGRRPRPRPPWSGPRRRPQRRRRPPIGGGWNRPRPPYGGGGGSGFPGGGGGMPGFPGGGGGSGGNPNPPPAVPGPNPGVLPPAITNPVAGGGQPGFDWRRWGAGHGGMTLPGHREKVAAHEKKFGRGSYDLWQKDPSKGKYWKGRPSWMTNSIQWGEGTAAPTWQDMGYKDQATFDNKWKIGKDGRSLVFASDRTPQILDVGYGTWWRGRGGSGVPSGPSTPITTPTPRPTPRPNPPTRKPRRVSGRINPRNRRVPNPRRSRRKAAGRRFGRMETGGYRKPTLRGRKTSDRLRRRRSTSRVPQRRRGYFGQ